MPDSTFAASLPNSACCSVSAPKLQREDLDTPFSSGTVVLPPQHQPARTQRVARRHPFAFYTCSCSHLPFLHQPSAGSTSSYSEPITSPVHRTTWAGLCTPWLDHFASLLTAWPLWALCSGAAGLSSGTAYGQMRSDLLRCAHPCRSWPSAADVCQCPHLHTFGLPRSRPRRRCFARHV